MATPGSEYVIYKAGEYWLSWSQRKIDAVLNRTRTAFALDVGAFLSRTATYIVKVEESFTTLEDGDKVQYLISATISVLT